MNLNLIKAPIDYSMSFKTFIFGLLLMAYGIITLMFNYQYTNTFARSPFLEKWFGSMYTFFKATSALACAVGLIYIVGLGDNLMDFVTRPLQKIFG